MFYVKSATSNSERGHSSLSSDPAIKIEVLSSQPTLPFRKFGGRFNLLPYHKKGEYTMRDNQIVNIVNQKLTGQITLPFYKN